MGNCFAKSADMLLRYICTTVGRNFLELTLSDVGEREDFFKNNQLIATLARKARARALLVAFFYREVALSHCPTIVNEFINQLIFIVDFFCSRKPIKLARYRIYIDILPVTIKFRAAIGHGLTYTCQHFS